ncbi:MAG: hypothetical protein LBU65_01735 [Planctomycetaceae bacterium]|jgi:hypothetical protein|nr:hypothetical protein [Planctomycetaceae bacterium]
MSLPGKVDLPPEAFVRAFNISFICNIRFRYFSAPVIFWSWNCFAKPFNSLYRSIVFFALSVIAFVVASIAAVSALNFSAFATEFVQK